MSKFISSHSINLTRKTICIKFLPKKRVTFTFLFKVIKILLKLNPGSCSTNSRPKKEYVYLGKRFDHVWCETDGLNTEFPGLPKDIGGSVSGLWYSTKVHFVGLCQRVRIQTMVVPKTYFPFTPPSRGKTRVGEDEGGGSTVVVG